MIEQHKIDTDALVKKWESVLEHDSLPAIQDNYKKTVTAVLLENQETFLRSEQEQLHEAAPVNNISGGEIKTFDPVMISLIRQASPNLMAYDIASVQPLTAPTGLIFAMRSKYENQAGPEALFNEANPGYSATADNGDADARVGGAADESAPGAGDADPLFGMFGQDGYANGMSTGAAEALGQGGDDGHFRQMAFNIDKVTVTAKSRALKAEYTTELQQDLKAVHGLDAEAELSNILTTEIVAEMNREMIRTVYSTAVLGCESGTAQKGVYNLDADADGRWSVEKFKGLLYQIEREANAIARTTKRGKGNVMICSADVASALAMAGVLDYAPAIQGNNNITPDTTQGTFAGILNGRIRVYVDPYFESTNGSELFVLGYKGTNPYDAGLFYCPYVPLQKVRAVGENTFQPKIGFKTRYGMVANPFAGGARNDQGIIKPRSNEYYRICRVDGLGS